MNNRSSPRTELLHNIDILAGYDTVKAPFGTAAIRCDSLACGGRLPCVRMQPASRSSCTPFAELA